MKSVEEVNEIISDHEKRIVALESHFEKKQKNNIKKERKPLSDYVLELRDKNFFSKPKIVKEVHEKLDDVYPCLVNRVAVVLIRLFKKKVLRKTTKNISGEITDAYVW